MPYRVIEVPPAVIPTDGTTLWTSGSGTYVNFVGSKSVAACSLLMVTSTLTNAADDCMECVGEVHFRLELEMKFATTKMLANLHLQPCASKNPLPTTVTTVPPFMPPVVGLRAEVNTVAS